MSLNSNQETSQVLKRAEVAKLLGVSERTVDRLIESGELPAFKIGRLVRIYLADVYALSTPTAPAAGTVPRTPAVGATSVSAA